LIISIASLVALAVVIGVVAAFTYKGGTTYRIPGAKKFSLDEIYNGTFQADRTTVHWVPEGEFRVTAHTPSIP
jgi:dipeptidyl aminopeptidase